MVTASHFSVLSIGNEDSRHDTMPDTFEGLTNGSHSSQNLDFEEALGKTLVHFKRRSNSVKLIPNKIGNLDLGSIRT